MKLRPHGWPLPRPKAIHHMVEDFLTEWEGPISHIQPLRRFLEHCVQTDLRAFYAGKVASCSWSVFCSSEKSRVGQNALSHQFLNLFILLGLCFIIKTVKAVQP